MRSASVLSHARAILVLGLPIIGSHLAQMALTVTDTLLLGRYGVAELAAATIGGTAFFVIFILGAGFGQAIMPLVAEAIGRGDEVQVRRDSRMGLWLSAGYGALALPVFWYSGRWLSALGQAPEVADLAQQFLRILGFGMMPALMVMSLKSSLSALGRPQVVLWVTIVAVVLNIVVASTLIFGRWGAPELGVRGAAISTLAVQWATLAALAAYAHFSPAVQRFHLFKRFWRPDWSVLRAVFRLGWPIGVTGLAESGLFASATVMMGWVGTVALAAHGIAMQAAALAFMVHLGLSNAATVLTGRAMGEEDPQSLREAAAVAIALSAGFAALIIGLFLTFPHPILVAFLDTAQPDAAEILTYGTTLLALAALFQLGDAMQVMALGLLRGIKDTRVPMWAAAISYWGIGIPVSYGLGFVVGWGGVGVWLGLSAGLAAASGLMMVRFWRKAPRPV
jgi:MATE family multidrug resistance protein